MGQHAAPAAPDGLDEWLDRRHGDGQPNEPRPLTAFRVRKRGHEYVIEGDNGTTVVIDRGNGTVPLAVDIAGIFLALSD